MAQPNIWNYNDPPKSEFIEKMGFFTREMYAKAMPHSDENMIRFFSLYNFILNNLDVPAAELAPRIVQDGAPMFSAEEVSALQKKIWAQRNLPLARRLAPAQRGGNQTTGAGANGKTSALDADPSRSKLFDRIVRTRMYPLVQKIPPAFDGFIPFVFFLYGLEQMEIIGPIIGTFLDTITLGLPLLANAIKLAVRTSIAVAPIPYAGFMGDIAAYLVGLFFLIVAFTMNVGRKMFGTAFKNGLEMVPLIGENLFQGAVTFETGFERYLRNKQRFVDSVGKVSPHMAQFIEYWAPSETPMSGPPVIFNPDKFELDLLRKAMDKSDKAGVVSMLKDPAALGPEAVAELGLPTTEAKKGGRRRTGRKIRRRKNRKTYKNPR